MIAHVVLFRLRSNLSESARTALAAAFETALEEIPTIRRARVGTRVVHGRPYEQLMSADYPYAAILEFDDVTGLKAYLEHQAHALLASRFFDTFEGALMYDFDLQDGAAGLTSLR
jgi:hypothetical protein